MNPRALDIAPAHGWRRRWHAVIFGHDTTAGRAFDVALLVVIGLSVLVVMLETVASVRAQWGRGLKTAEWVITVLFTAEYALRLVCVRRPMRYALSFYGLVDLLAVVPSYASLFVADTQALAVVRALRLLRIFRILKLPEYLGQASLLLTALRQNRQKIIVFLTSVLLIVVVVGALMYVIEGPDNGFRSIPTAMYWAVVTLTTVGYGDLAPQTVFGRFIATLVMLTGYGIIAVPTGIVTAGMIRTKKAPARRCAACHGRGHDADARHCKHCGAGLTRKHHEPQTHSDERG